MRSERTRLVKTWAALGVVTLLGVASLGASVGAADELDALRERMAGRDARVQSLKAAGMAGETFVGVLEFVPGKSPDDAAWKLIGDENADRKTLYATLARREGATPEAVADRAARRNFSRAAVGHWLKFPDGQWRQKR